MPLFKHKPFSLKSYVKGIAWNSCRQADNCMQKSIRRLSSFTMSPAQGDKVSLLKERIRDL